MIETILALAPHVGHQALFGALAAAGFGVLFNFGPRELVWCAVMGAVALTVRTLGQSADWSLEAASFCAAFFTSACVVVFRSRLGAATNAIALAGCIPMVPGAFFGHALLGFFSLTAPEVPDMAATLASSVQAFLRVAFTLGAIGAGLAIPSHVLASRDF